MFPNGEKSCLIWSWVVVLGICTGHTGGVGTEREHWVAQAPCVCHLHQGGTASLG